MALKVFEGFAGYGGGSFAFKRLEKENKDYHFEVIGYSEIDKYACELFDLNHKQKNGEKIKNYGDITLIDPKTLPDFDLFIGGFPCQPFSSAGLQLGEDDPYNRGTLLYHILRICKAKKPRYIILENVKGFLSKKFVNTRTTMENMLRNLGYVSKKKDTAESPLRVALLNSKDYGIAQNRERVWMFARLGGLPKDFDITPPRVDSNLKLKDFLDPIDKVPKSMYLSTKQIEHLKEKHHVDSFMVDEPLCFDVYNHKIKRDGYSITLTMPEHNSFRVIESNKNKEVVRKMSATEQFRLMGLEGLEGIGKDVDINFGNQSYTQLSRRAGNGWDVNLVSILFDYIFKKLLVFDKDFKGILEREK